MTIDNTILKEKYPGSEGLVYAPMLIHASTDIQLRNACDSGSYFGQLKKDGAWYQFIKGHGGECYLFSRTISKKTDVPVEKIENVPHIKEALKLLPNNTILIGEIYYPGMSSKNTVEVMGCLPTKAVERQAGSRGLIHYYIYDILMYDGVNLIDNHVGNELRYKILEKVFYLYSLDKYDFLELAQVWYEDLYSKVGDALASGEEGMVIKKKDGLYVPDGRPVWNLKAKRVDFADVIIMGFEEPTTFYYGKEIENWPYWVSIDPENNTIRCRLPIGCYYNEGEEYKAVTKPYYMGWSNSRIRIGAHNKDGNLIEIGTIHSGISDEMKQDMTECPDKYFYKVCAIQCMEKDSVNKTIRHGFFKFMREDKDPKDCTIDNIF